MRKVFVGYDASSLTQWQFAGSRWVNKEKGIEYRLAPATDTDVTGGLMHGPYDYLFIGTHGGLSHLMSLADLNHEEVRILGSDRPSKRDMVVIAERVMDADPSVTKYMPIPTWGRRGVPQFTDGPMVLKADHGARGIGQIVFDPVVVPLSKLLTAVSHQRLNDIHEMGLKVTFDDRETEEQCLAQIAESFHIQRLVGNITTETRVLAYGTNHNHWRAFDRKRHEGEYVQARGNQRMADQGMSFRDLAHWQEIKSLILHLLQKTPVLSLDVFHTHDGKWGIFEYSNQFGMDYVDQHLRQTFLRNACEHLVAELDAKWSDPRINITNIFPDSGGNV